MLTDIGVLLVVAPFWYLSPRGSYCVVLERMGLIELRDVRLRDAGLLGVCLEFVF